MTIFLSCNFLYLRQNFYGAINNRDGLCEMLESQGYSVKSTDTINEAQKIIKNEHFSLLIFDVMLPDGSSFDLCKKIRNDGSATPILFLTACDEEYQIVKGLDLGADDYVTKPFKMLELLSRIRALIRRNSNAKFVSRNLIVDTDNMTVKKDGKNIFVTKTEFQILSTLMKNSGAIVSRSSLLQNIWDDNGNFIDDNTLSVHISRLREKIGAQKIVTVRGVGYRLENDR